MHISVIIPTYKPQDYIWQCLDSLVGQTLPKNQWEVIIILNGCKEPWLSKLTLYIRTHNLYNAILFQTDIAGVSNARNIGLDIAHGEYFTFIDDDDYVSNVFLEQLSQIATPDIIAISNIHAFSKEQNHLPHRIEKDFLIKASYGILPFYKAKRFLGAPYMQLIHRDIIGSYRYDTRFKNGEDSLFLFTISCNMKNVCFTHEDAIYFRRIRPNSATTSQSFFPMIKNRLQLFFAYGEYFIKNPKRYNIYFFITRLIACFHF